MGRFILILLLVPSLLIAFFTTQVEPTISEAYVPNPPAPQVTPDSLNDFNETGVLTFYPNNSGPVPYLFYTDERGNTVSKALVFMTLTTNSLSSWSGSTVTIVGHLDAEHVLVSDITYVSGP